jgi:6-phosphogluconolactonase/glucosamine-6-phosphate isomerase/deaminase
MKIEVYSNADAIAQKTAALVAAEARAALAACDAMSGGRTAWQMRALAGADAVLEIKDADVALTGLYQGGRRMKLTYPILKRSRRVLWLVTASEKAEMLPRLRFGDAQIPAGRVRADHALALADRTAAGRLDNYSEAGVA